MISVDTKLIALLGNPLGQSISNRMQNAAFRARDLDYCYFPIETRPETLGTIVNAVRCMNFAGLGVTKPDKIAIIDLLDELDPLAAMIGAVNTVDIRDGKLIGYNTDGEGGVRALKNALKRDVSRERFYCFGAGGCARALCFTLANQGVRSITLTDLYDETAKAFAEEINERFGAVAAYLPHDDRASIRRAFSESSVVLNCSGVGMAPHLEESPIEADAFRSGQLAFDATYNPEKTRFLQDAEQAGAAILNGLGMLVHQGALQFQLWTGLEEPTELMFREAERALAESAIRSAGAQKEAR